MAIIVKLQEWKPTRHQRLVDSCIAVVAWLWLYKTVRVKMIAASHLRLEKVPVGTVQWEGRVKPESRSHGAAVERWGRILCTSGALDDALTLARSYW